MEGVRVAGLIDAMEVIPMAGMMDTTKGIRMD
jgi:hypothetical protein